MRDSFLAELEDLSVKQVSVETAQSKLDCAVLEKLPSKTIILGVLDLGTHEVDPPANSSPNAFVAASRMFQPSAW